MKGETLRQAVATVVTSSLETDRFTVAESVDRIIAEFPDMVDAAADELIRGRLKDLVKKYLAERVDEDEQAMLPGLRLPVAIMVRKDDGAIYYVTANRATLAELESGYHERVQNKNRVSAKLQAYKRMMNQLRPIMNGNPEMTVSEALAKVVEKAA